MKEESSPSTRDVRGTLQAARANARTVAALTSNPGCTRRRVLDASSVPVWALAEALGRPSDRGQSPFAIVTGDRFEYRLKKGSDYELLVDALRPYVELPDDDDVEVLNLKAVKGHRVGEPMLRARAKKTEEALAAIANDDPGAPHIVDHPVLIFDLAGTPVFLEPDGLACRVGKKLELVEIKSYAIIDDQADPDKLASTAGQSAVYLLALRATLSRLGLDPDQVLPSVLLVAPRNFGRRPVAYRVPLRKKVMALERVLRAVPKTDEVLSTLPSGFTLDVDPEGKLSTRGRAAALESAVNQLPMLFVPECLSSCDMAKYCRHQAVQEDLPARLGRAARDGLAGVSTLAEALSFAKSDPGDVPAESEDVADGLRRAWSAIERARRAIPPPKAAQTVRRRKK